MELESDNLPTAINSMAASIAHILHVPPTWIMHVAHQPALQAGAFWVYMISTTRTRDSVFRKPQEKVISRIRVDANPLRHWLLSVYTHPQQAFFMINCMIGPFACETDARDVTTVVSQGTRGSERRYAFMMNWALANRKRFISLVRPATLISNPLFLPELLSSTSLWGIVNRKHAQAKRKKKYARPRAAARPRDHEPRD